MRADAHGGGSEARTVRDGVSAFQPENAHVVGGRGNPVDRGTTEGVPVVRTQPCKGRRGGGLGHAGQREASAARRASSQPPAGPGTGVAVPAGRRGASEAGPCRVKAAPADEARAVHHTRHREVPVPEELRRGPERLERESGEPYIEWARCGSVEADRGE
jgi:hypothetical protein